MKKQFLKIKPSYKKEIVWIEDAPYLAHFNRGEWKDKKYVFIGDVGMGFNVPCIEYLVNQNLYYDEIKPEILQKSINAPLFISINKTGISFMYSYPKSS